MKNQRINDKRITKEMRHPSEKTLCGPKRFANLKVIDTHCDIPWQFRKRFALAQESLSLFADSSSLNPPLQADLANLQAGGAGVAVFACYLPTLEGGPGAIRRAVEQLRVVQRLCELHSGAIAQAFCAADIERINAEGKIAILAAVEGGHALEDSLDAIWVYHRLGARYLTLTHILNNSLGDSSTDKPRAGGLTDFGRTVITELNRLGMLVDVSHSADSTTLQAIELSRAPVIFSHSCAGALCSHPRNASDDLIRLAAGRGGMIMLCFAADYLSEEIWRYCREEKAERLRQELASPQNPDRINESMNSWRRTHPRPQTNIALAADHIDHIRKVAGIDAIGIGSDFDGIDCIPIGLENASKYPALFEELDRRGYTELDLMKIARLNFLRVLKDAEKIARQQ